MVTSHYPEDEEVQEPWFRPGESNSCYVAKLLRRVAGVAGTTPWPGWAAGGRGAPPANPNSLT